MTVQDAYTQLKELLQTLYEPREAGNIANAVVETISGFSNSSRLLHKHDLLSEAQENRWKQIKERLLQKEPMQYALGEAHFYGLSFFVNEHVLIPRPETEELVEWMVSELNANKPNARILDIGTGSGCIPVSLKKQLPGAQVSALDISEKALTVAAQNARQHQTEVTFYHADVLDAAQWEALPQFDCIVSNPPYILPNEAADMHGNVLQFEPHLALFVPGNDPLLFYNAISRFAKKQLHTCGSLFFEINEAFAKETVALLSAMGFVQIELKQDMQGKDRMVKAEKKG